MLYALGFVGLFTLGGMTGLFLASLPLDVDLTDTYFVVAHFHYIMVGGSVMAYFGALHFWWPKITGRMYPEVWARIAAVLIFVGFNATFFPQYILGMLGMPRRYATYPERFQALHLASSGGAVLLALGYLLPFVYFAWSLRSGRVAGPNPFDATGLEWQTSSPPPTHNFDRPPPAPAGVYDYDPNAPRPAA
jgi:cytochrome c oxidase subunit I